MHMYKMYKIRLGICIERETDGAGEGGDSVDMDVNTVKVQIPHCQNPLLQVKVLY